MRGQLRHICAHLFHPIDAAHVVVLAGAWWLKDQLWFVNGTFFAFYLIGLAVALSIRRIPRYNMPDFSDAPVPEMIQTLMGVFFCYPIEGLRTDHEIQRYAQDRVDDMDPDDILSFEPDGDEIIIFLLPERLDTMEVPRLNFVTSLETIRACFEGSGPILEDFISDVQRVHEKDPEGVTVAIHVEHGPRRSSLSALRFKSIPNMAGSLNPN